MTILLTSTEILAKQSEWQQDNDVAVRLIAAQQSIADSDTVFLGLDVKLDKGVYTYWRNPGFAGTPPSIDWQQSSNLKTANILFPTPKRIGTPPFDAIGYENHVMFPIKVSLEKSTTPLKIQAHLDLLVCRTTCLPKTFDFAMQLPKGSGAKTEESDLIEKALGKLPKNTQNSAIKIGSAHIKDEKLILQISSDTPLETPDIFIENDKGVFFNAPEIIKADNHHAITAAIPYEADVAFELSDLTATIVNGANALTQNLGPIKKNNAMPFGSILFIAVLGGFILNLMPCVLPVLSLKIFSMIRHGQKTKPVIRRAFLSTANGILFSFLLLAGIMIGLKASGHAIGWGVHFQQPLFLTFMIVVLTFFAANLWGFYEVGMPRIIQKLVDPKLHPHLSGDFANGALATLLATPCSAPFLGTAISFALAAGWSEILAVFLALGLGMAAPYLLIATRPQIATLFPQPGPWMERLSQILGCGLAATALWLLFVLDTQIGNRGTYIIAGATTLMLFMMALRHKKVTPRITYPAFTTILITVFCVAYVGTTPKHLTPSNGLWQEFDEAAIEKNLQNGKKVFIDITADWCLTCKMNKRLALADDEVTQRLFHDKAIIAMQGDWTNPNPIITNFLHKYGRYGVPFNILFTPEHPSGLVLPELLTPHIVLEALEDERKTH